jgi:CyaY protein
MDEKTFDRIADEELHRLERALGDFDPDEVDFEVSSGVLRVKLGNGHEVVINSHRAAGQIWMAALTEDLRKAWHFSPQPEGEGWRWRTADDELHAALSQLLSKRLRRPVII